MERSGNFYKTIRLGYILISVLIGCIAYNSFYEWQEIEALELDNKKIDEFRKEINNINIQMIKFSLFGETILEWNDKDIEHYHAQWHIRFDIFISISSCRIFCFLSKKISRIPLGCIERICNGHPIALSRSIMNLSS